MEVLKLIQAGYSSAKVADMLFISTPTVSFHLRNCFLKLKVNNRLSALRIANRFGLLDREGSD